MEMSTLGSPHLLMQVRHDDKGVITVTTSKYTHMNDCSKGTQVCSKVVIVTVPPN
jgi:hypothetical protein